MFKAFENAIANINDVMYGYLLIIILILGGLYFSFKTKFVQIRLIKEQIKAVMEKPSEEGGISAFQALMVSTASRVGTGNIVGVSTALCLGGYGSVFWMWVIAIVGAASAFTESTLAQIYKKRGKDGYYGGPPYYIEKGIGSRGLALVFSVILILTYGFGFNMLASYNLQSTFSAYSFYNPDVTPKIIGAIIAVLVGYCLIGGGKRIAKVTSVIVPIMGIMYILVALGIVAVNFTHIPEVFAKIFSSAFDFKAIFGGFSGSCVMYGIKRGLFSNEAGVGSAPNASATADVKHPAKQGLVQVLSVFLDTILVCSATAFMCMFSGIEATPELSGAPYVQAALQSTLGAVGPIFITVAMTFFAFTTLVGNLYYVDQCIFYILKKEPSKKVKIAYDIIASVVIFCGAILSAEFLWNFADMTMGIMVLINIPVLFVLNKYSNRALADYEKQKKDGEDPVFRPRKNDYQFDDDVWG